jgi:hypothetical protein
VSKPAATAMQPQALLYDILETLVVDAGLKAVLLVDKGGRCIASSGDQACMEKIAETHFKDGLSLASLQRDPDGSTVLSDCSGDAVRFESVGGGQCILTLVSEDPMMASRRRPSIDAAKRQLDSLLAEAL